MPSPSRSASSSFALVSTAVVLLAGCEQGVGGTQCGPPGSSAPMCERTAGPGCDEFTTDVQRRVVYRDDGQPAYAGQALILENCGSCHAEGSSARVGAPAGLDFDVSLVSAAGSAGEEEARHLLRTQAIVHAQRDEIYEQVVSGAMPPRNYVPDGSRYAFEDGTPLPGIRDPEAHEILRAWLSCGSPVVERTTAAVMPCSANSDCHVTGFCDLGAGQCVGVGDVVPEMAAPIQPQWSQIYARIVATSCAGLACHVGGAGGGLRMDDAASGYAALVGVMPGSMSVSCMGNTHPYVDPGNAAGSLLVHKIEGVDDTGAPVCGSPMPLGSRLSPTAIQAIRDWIDMGAMND